MHAVSSTSCACRSLITRAFRLRRLLATAFMPGVVLALGGTATHAQFGFTELALGDTLFSTGADSDFWIASAAPADVDADGDQDLLVAGYHVVYFADVRDLLILYRNDGPEGDSGWRLTPLPLDATGLYFGAGDIAWGDYDNDGDPDAVVAGQMSTTLYRNDAGALTRTSAVLPGYEEEPDFLTMDQRSLTWADYDNDGDLDLLVPSVWQDLGPAPAVLLRNDGPGVGDAWTFTDSGHSLPQAANAATAWVDMDADGDLDLMFGGMGQFDAPILDLYRNDGGTLAQADTALAKIVHGTADWGDADGDGDFDLVVAGNLMLPDETGETVVRILLNEAGGWSPVDVVHEFQSAAEPWLDFEGVTWADYDSDGDVDLLITGQQLGDGEIVGRSQVYANDAGTFTPAGAPLPGPNFGNTGGAFAWFDVDGDNDLDYFQAGGYYMPGGNGLIESRGLLFRNDASATNAAPTAPGALSSTTQSGNRVALSWTAASDDGTPQPALTYDLYVTSSTGAAIAMSTMPQPGNVSRSTAWSLRDLPDGEYAWAVRARDSAFNRGPIAEASFQVGTVAAPPAFVRAPAFALAAAGANPAGSAGQFLLTIDRPQSVTVALYDAMGRRVAVMHDGILPAGRHRITLDGEGLANGAYFVRAVGGDGSAVQRITLER